MRLTTASFAMALVLLGWGACGRTELDLAQAEGDEGEGSAEGGARSSANSGSGASVSASAGSSAGASAGAFAGAGGSSFSGSMPPKGGLPSIAGSFASSTPVTGGTSLVGGAPASGGRPVLGGSFVSSSSAGRPMVGGTTIVASSGSYRPAGTIARSSSVAGSVVAGRSGGSGGSSGGSISSRGGSTVGGRTGSTVISTGGRSTILPLESDEELIDDLSDGDRFLVKSGGRVGAWKTWNDGTPGGAMYPDPNTPFVPTDTGDPNAKYAVYVKGTGFTSQGSSVSLGLGAPYDASKYKGIAFWAKSDAGQTYARVQFPDKDTALDGGLCKMSGPAAEMCYDHYGWRFSFDPGWGKFRILFENLTQDGWGRKGTAFDPSTLFELIFQFPANANYAVWIDNLAFILK